MFLIFYSHRTRISTPYFLKQANFVPHAFWEFLYESNLQIINKSFLIDENHFLLRPRERGFGDLF